MLVKYKPTGQLGTIDDNEYDESIYEQVGQKPSQQQAIPNVPIQQSNPLRQLLSFFANKTTENVIDPLARLGGMGVDFLKYNTTQDEAARQKIGEEYGKKFAEQEDWASRLGFATEKTPYFDAGKFAGELGKTGAELTSILMPVGKGISGMAKMGAASGALRGISESQSPDDLLGKVLAGGAGGGIAGGALGVGGKVLSAGGKFLNSTAKQISNKAAQGISKATPTQWAKAVAEHGYDLNDLVKEFVPKGAGYDDLLGEVAKRGKGGVLGFKMGQAEDVIQRSIERAGSTIKVGPDDVVRELNNELRRLASIPGNENNIAALTAFIDQTKKLYKTGITQKQLLNIKRAAESKFGKAIVDESTGSVEAQGQKILANWSRNILKKLNPNIAKQLDTQSKIFTLQPIIEKARGTLNTQGSQIRQGAFNSLTDLINPFAYTDAAMNNPKIASRFINLGENKLPQASSRLLPEILGRGARLAGSKVGSLLPDSNEQTDDKYYNETNNDVGYDAATIPQSPEANQEADRINEAIKQITQLEFVDIASGGKNLAKLEVLRKALQDQVVKQAGPKITETQKKFANASIAGQKALDLLNKGNVATGVGQDILGGLGEKLGYNTQEQQQYRSTLALARTSVRNALLGANMTPKELESIKAFIPEFDDAPTTAKYKLETFIQLMKQFGEGNVIPSATVSSPDMSSLLAQ